MAKIGEKTIKPGGKRGSIKKKTKQGNGTFSKKFHNKNSKNYRKVYRGQGK
jgi:hypothetical protein